MITFSLLLIYWYHELITIVFDSIILDLVFFCVDQLYVLAL